MFDVATVRIRGPLAGAAPGLAGFLRQEGYRENTVRFLTQVLARLSAWMQDEGFGQDALDRSLVDRFVGWSKAAGYRQPGSSRGMAPLVEFLITNGQVPAARFALPEPEPGSAQEAVAAFLAHLLQERGVTVATTRGYGPFAAQFLDSVTVSGRVVWSAVDAGAVQDFLSGWSAGRSVRPVATMASVLRALLRFAYAQGWTGQDLSGTVGKVASRREEHLAEGLTPDEVQRLVASISTDTRMGARDRAIIVLLSRLGLRAGEVAKLRLEDLHWRTSTLHVRDTKGRRDLVLPLPVDVGNTLVDYLRVRAVGTGQRALFLRERAPIGAMSTSGISGIVADRAAAVGLGVVHAHRLRHAAAAAVIARDGTLTEAGQLLGHARLGTTAIYARTDADSLRPLATEWPESRS